MQNYCSLRKARQAGGKERRCGWYRASVWLSLSLSFLSLRLTFLRFAYRMQRKCVRCILVYHVQHTMTSTDLHRIYSPTRKSTHLAGEAHPVQPPLLKGPKYYSLQVGYMQYGRKSMAQPSALRCSRPYLARKCGCAETVSRGDLGWV